MFSVDEKVSHGVPAASPGVTPVKLAPSGLEINPPSTNVTELVLN